MGLFKKTYR